MGVFEVGFSLGRHFAFVANMYRLHKCQNCEYKQKLELCAFVQKGEHNVYSLVPNIPVCIYIDQKWIYIK